MYVIKGVSAGSSGEYGFNETISDEEMASVVSVPLRCAARLAYQNPGKWYATTAGNLSSGGTRQTVKYEPDAQ